MFCLPSPAQLERSETEEANDGHLSPKFMQSKRYLANSIATGPKLSSHPEQPLLPGNMMMYPNIASSAGSYSEFLSGSSLFLHEHVEIPSVGGGNEVVYIPPTGDTISVQSINGQLNTATGDPIGDSVTGDPQMVPRTQLGILDGEQNLQCQGLSLSLNTQMSSAVHVSSSHYQYSNPGMSSFVSRHLPISVEGTISWKGYESSQSEELRNDECLQSGFPGGNHNGVKTEAFCNPQCSVNPKEIHSGSYLSEPSVHANSICNSKYLKATQQLLDEVVNVQKALKRPVLGEHQNFHGIGQNFSKEIDGRSIRHSMLPSMNGMSSVQNDTISSCELSPAERQDLQNKKTKLLSILDEVDRRYKQYYHQMQILISWFDMVAGSGAAKPYTALALQTISCHFRCMRDAISGQIQVTRRSLGEQDTSTNVQGGRIPRLRYVDWQLGQHRALQQLGVMRHAWRPQRGLPESSVSILRAWLFEHFLHPYPKDSEKIMLARQTGLTRGQVANWFINARVRLWKPMVEDIYKEEFSDLEINSNSSPENAPKAPKDHSWAYEDRGEELQESLTSTAAGSAPLRQFHDSKSDFIHDVELNGPTARVGFQIGVCGDDFTDCGVMRLKGDKRPNVDDCSLYPNEFIPGDQNGDGSPTAAAAPYPIPELGDFAVDGRVSLALGLRNCESDVLTMCGGTHIRRDDGAASSVGPDAMDYHCMDPENQRHRFGNPHLLHDFVV